jgi:hypothetical protein
MCATSRSLHVMVLARCSSVDASSVDAQARVSMLSGSCVADTSCVDASCVDASCVDASLLIPDHMRTGAQDESSRCFKMFHVEIYLNESTACSAGFK